MKRPKRGRIFSAEAGAGLSILCVGALALGLWQSRRVRPPADGPPRLTVASVEQDFGTVLEGTMLQHAFHLHNAGGRRVIVRELGCSSCGEGDEDRLVIEPGESAWIELVLPTGGAQGALRYKRQYWTSDPSRPRLQLALAAKIEPDDQDAPTLAGPSP